MSALDVNQSAVSDLKDPFTAECLQSAFFHCSRDWNGNPQYRATGEFKNGNTEGKQRFEADSFALLVKKVDDFTQSL